MRNLNRSFRKTAVAALFASAALTASVPAQAEPIVGLLGQADGTGSALVTFDSATQSAAGAPIAISGLTVDSRLVGIDLRPTTGVLYGVGNAGGVYTINRTSGAATLVGTIAMPLSGTSFGVDFSPVS